MSGDPSIQALEARKSIYVFLASVYLKELSEPVLHRLHESGLLEELNEQGSEFDVASLRPVDAQLVEELARQYARVFIGPGPHAPPYESVHNPNDPKKGRLWGDSTVDMKKMIEFTGLEFAGKEYHGVPDHISVGFEFMARLLTKEIDGRESGDLRTADAARTIQERFHKEHLAPWVPAFCERVSTQAFSSFYRQIGLLTRDFMRSEDEVLGTAADLG